MSKTWMALGLAALSALTLTAALAGEMAAPMAESTQTVAAGPRIDVTHPEEGFNLWGNVNIVAVATDSDGVQRMAMYVGEQEMKSCELTGSQDYCAFEWDTTAVPDATYDITVKAWDRAGNESSRTVAGCIDNKSLSGNLDFSVARGPRPAADMRNSEYSGAQMQGQPEQRADLPLGTMVDLEASATDPGCAGVDKTFVWVRPANSDHWYLKGICTAQSCNVQWDTSGSRPGVYVARAVAWNDSDPPQKFVTDVPLRIAAAQ